MIVAIKTLDGKQFDVEIEAGMLVSQVKAIVEAASPDRSFAADRQKLIYAGKVLDDAKTVAEFGVVEKGFIVCMLAKPKAAAAAAPPASAAAAPTASAPAATPAPLAAPAPAAPTMQQFGGHGMDAYGDEDDEDGDYVEGEEGEEGEEGFEQVALDPATVASLVAVTGSPEEAVVQALAAAYGNADVAADYLLNGMPEMDEGDEAGGYEGLAPPGGGGFGGLNLLLPGAAPAHAAPLAPLDQLRFHPQFNALREAVQANPAMLQTAVQQIGDQSPEMLAAIQANPAAFLAMLNEPLGAAAPAQSPVAQLPPATLQGAFNAAAAASPPAAAAGPAFSAAEEASVARLCEMGFPRGAVVEAFVACDRNEEMAANFLFDN